MEVSAKSLRTRVGELLACVDRGETVVVTYRGKPRARLVGLGPAAVPRGARDSVAAGFGMWKDREDIADVDAFVSALRRPRDVV